MIELSVTQGSPEWHAARAKCFNASEAPAMMGVSPYKTRSALIAEKATGIIPEVDAATQSRFDMGHMTEALARTIIEQIIGEELYPIVATDDTGKYLASSDGSTMLVNIGYEHKLWNENLAAEVAQGNVPESHRWQLDHQFLVFGFEKIIFVVSDGTAEKMVHCWYYPQPDRIAALVAGWEQFAKDVAAYVPEETKATAVAEKVEGLPALFVQVEGRVVASNMDAFKSAAEAFIGRLPKAAELQTDQDFANADQAAKDCKAAEDRLQVVKQQAQSQAVSIDEAFRAIDTISEKIRAARLSLEKVVKAEKENRRSEIVTAAMNKFRSHLDSLQNRVSVGFTFAGPNFGEAIKGLKSLDSMRDKLSVALANAKIEANAIADRIDANRKTVEDMSLFPDFAQVCTKPADDFAALLAMRIAQRKEAEERRLEAERQRIRVEEQAKAQREAEERAAAEKREADAKAAAEQEERNRIAAEGIRKLDAERKATEQSTQPEVVRAATVSNAELAPQAFSGKTMNLGQINAALGFTVSADFLASLGMAPVRQEKAAKLYDANKFPTICRLIQEHLGAVMLKSMELKAA